VLKKKKEKTCKYQMKDSRVLKTMVGAGMGLRQAGFIDMAMSQEI
jgi:hypothetical protein